MNTTFFHPVNRQSGKIIRWLILTVVLGHSFGAIAQSYNEPTPDSVIFDAYNLHQNTHVVYGKKSLDYLGSGDSNNDEVVNLTDTALTNYRSDVNADGVLNEKDKKMIVDYVNGEGVLPGLELNELSQKEKEEYIYFVYTNVDNTKFHNDPNWDCNEYFRNLHQNFTGINNISGYFDMLKYHGEPTPIDSTLNGRFNIKSLISNFTLINGEPHTTSAFLVGDTLTNPNSYFFIDARTGAKGDFIVRKDSGDFLDIGWYGLWKSFVGDDIFGERMYIMFKYNENQEAEIVRISPHIAQVNPKIINIDASVPDKKDIEYSSTLNLSGSQYSPQTSTNLTLGEVLHVYGFYEAKSVNFLYEERKLIEKISLFDGEKGNYNYTAKVEYTEILKQKTTDISGNGGYGEVTIDLKSKSVVGEFEVRDFTAPEIYLKNFGDVNYVSDLSVDKSMIISNVTDNGKVRDYGIRDVSSTQMKDGTINEVNYTVSGTAWADDVSDNEATKSWSFNVRDMEGPQPLAVPNDTTIYLNTLEGGELTPEITGYATATDNSELPVDIQYTYELTSEDESVIEYKNTLTFTDIAGNQTTATQKITVEKVNRVNLGTNLLFEVYPNPTDKKIYIATSQAGRITLWVYSSTGTLLVATTGTGPLFSVDLSALNPGLYALCMSDPNGKVAVQKIVKQ